MRKEKFHVWKWRCECTCVSIRFLIACFHGPLIVSINHQHVSESIENRQKLYTHICPVQLFLIISTSRRIHYWIVNCLPSSHQQHLTFWHRHRVGLGANGGKLDAKHEKCGVRSVQFWFISTLLSACQPTTSKARHQRESSFETFSTILTCSKQH